jgi:hypothetical protein
MKMLQEDVLRAFIGVIADRSLTLLCASIGIRLFICFTVLKIGTRLEDAILRQCI